MVAERANSTSRRVIGYPSTCYGTRRVSHALPLGDHGVEYRRIRRLPIHRLPLVPSYWINRYDFFPLPDVDAVHMFNGVCAAKLPWLSSIEMEYPRYFGAPSRAAIDEAFSLAAEPYCKLLLPLSSAAREHYLRRVPAQFRERISRKVKVFTGGVSIPEQILSIRERFRAERRRSFVVSFVGRAFWHKAGPAVIRAVEGLRSQGADVRLVVVTDLLGKSHIVEKDEAAVGEMREFLRQTPWIERHADLSNDATLELIAKSDVLAFPSLDESLGWVAIEALGLGVPVVTSNIFALPELVPHGIAGYNIELPLDADRRWTGIAALNPEPRPSYDDAIDALARGCQDAFERLLGSEGLREDMSSAARRSYKERFEPCVAAKRLAGLLEAAL